MYKRLSQFEMGLPIRAVYILVPLVFVGEWVRKMATGELVRPAFVVFALIAIYAGYEAKRNKRAERVLLVIAVAVGGSSALRAAGQDFGGPDPAAALLALGGIGMFLVVLSERPDWFLSTIYGSAVLSWVVGVSGLEQISLRDLISRIGVTVAMVAIAPWLVGRLRRTLVTVTREQAARLKLQDSVSVAVKAVVVGGSASLEEAAVGLCEGSDVDLVVIERYRGARQRLIPNMAWTSGTADGFDLGLDQPLDMWEANILTEGGSVQRRGKMHELVVPIRGPAGVLGSVRLVAGSAASLADSQADHVESLAEIVGVTWRREAAEELADRRQGRLEAESRREEALATVARSLLVTKGDESLVTSVAAVVRSTSADIGVIGRVTGDPQEQLLVVRMEPGSGIVTTRVRVVPDNEALEALGQGHSVESGYGASRVPTALTRDGVESMLTVPVRVRGSLAGSIALASKTRGHMWPSGDRSVVERAAVLIGAFWEGEDNESTLRELLRSKDRFIASVSHELRTPLTAVLGLATALAETDGDLSENERIELASVVAEQAGDVSHIVEDLLVAARAESEMLTIVPASFNIDVEVARVIERFSHEVALDADTGATAFADVHRVRQILRNLVTNAVRYGGPKVVAQTTVDGATVEVRVSDNGEGVSHDHAEDIFDPYVRAHNAVGNPDSVGLGLAVARQLARLMGGDVTYQRTDVTTFCLTLPRYPDSVAPGSEGGQSAIDQDLASGQIPALFGGKKDGNTFEVLGVSPTGKRNP